MTTILSVRDVKKENRKKKIVENIYFDVKQGEGIG
ncbi:ABC transporter ATP-binding protein, partial [Bacillus anthracis]|nr:ABC transporter ATP-binding protein [Bacillus anthracis]